MATPIIRLDLDDKWSTQAGRLAAYCFFTLPFYTVLIDGHHFIGNLGRGGGG